MTAVQKPNRLAVAAARYAEHGWHVFPVQARGKQPIVKRGFLAATNDAQTVADWWRRWPHANIGLWPGRSGLAVVDLDGPTGVESAQTLGLLSEPTLECQSGREDGGLHLYFRHPGFTISNAAIGTKLDVRADGGYVILPPSVHPSGRVYRWQGRIDGIRDLPPGVVDVLRAAQTGALSRVQTEAGVRAAREIPFEPITEGGRNNALTRYAGRLLAKGLGEEEVLLSLHAINAQYVTPPLPAHEVNALVANIAGKETQKRLTATGTALELVPDGAEVQPEEHDEDPAELTAEQVAAAKALADRDLSGAPRWMWPDLSNLVGEMLPGDLIVLGGLMGNGKSSLLMSQMDAFSRAAMPTLYFPLEIDPEQNRLRWAAWVLNIDVVHVIRGKWHLLPEGSREAVHHVLDEQEANPYVHFATPRRVTFRELARWCRWGVNKFGCRVVMLDHFHRMEFAGDSAGSYRLGATEVARSLRDLARELDIALIAAAHLNRSNDPLDPYMAPALARLKETAALAEEAEQVLMVSRKLRANLPEKWAQQLREGRITEADLAEPDVMTVTCRKHRVDNRARDKAIYLRVQNGRVVSRAQSWRDAEEEQEPWYQR